MDTNQYLHTTYERVNHMHRSTLIAFIIPLIMLAVAMTYRYFSNDSMGQVPSTEAGSLYTDSVTEREIEFMVHDKVAKLKELGIDATSVEDKIIDSLSTFPAEIMASMDTQQINGMILSNIDWLLYKDEAAKSAAEPRQFFCFDMECMDLDNMYTIFVNNVAEISGDDLVFTDIKEDTSKVDFESGTGTQTISFSCNGNAYQYNASVYYDWFDVGMLTFMNDVISEQSNNRHLYVTSDGYQECIVFCQTKDWVARLKKSTGIILEQP